MNEPEKIRLGNEPHAHVGIYRLDVVDVDALLWDVGPSGVIACRDAGRGDDFNRLTLLWDGAPAERGHMEQRVTNM